MTHIYLVCFLGTPNIIIRFRQFNNIQNYNLSIFTFKCRCYLLYCYLSVQVASIRHKSGLPRTMYFAIAKIV